MSDNMRELASAVPVAPVSGNGTEPNAFKIEKVNMNCFKLYFFGSFLGAHHSEKQAIRRAELLTEHMYRWAKPWRVDAEAANIYCRDLTEALKRIEELESAAQPTPK